MENISSKEVLELVKDFPLQPRFAKVVITLNNIEEDGVKFDTNILSETQFILAVGPMVNGVEVGDRVLIDVEKMMVPVRQDNGNAIETVMQVKVNPVEVEDKVFAIIEDRFIQAIDNRKEVKL